MAFKMKGSPFSRKIEADLKTLDKNIQAASSRVSAGVEKRKAANVNEAGLTPMEVRRAEKKTRRSGESKYQADVRRAREKRRAEKKTKKTKTTISTDFKKDVNSPTNTKPGELKVNKELMRKKIVKSASKPAKAKTKVKAKAKTKLTRKQQYDAKGWKYDDTIEGYDRDGTKKKVAKSGPQTHYDKWVKEFDTRNKK